MSSMLDQAILDAESLREAAMKNAESAVVEKYSDEVRERVEKLLEQDPEDDMDLGMEEDPMAEPEMGMWLKSIQMRLGKELKNF